VKGGYAFDFVYADDRITEPMIRESGGWKQVSWDEAISFTAESLQHIIQRYGPDSLGVLGSARATNEENYLTQKFARIVAGTNNVDCCARVCHAPTAAAMKMMLGTGAATNSFSDIEQARTILICGANPTENHPIVGARIKQAVIDGARLIVIDPRKIELAEYSDWHLELRPGTNVPLLNSMACAIVEERLYDEPFVNERVSEWEEFREFIKQWSPERVASICGVEAGLIRKAVRAYAMEKPAMCIHGLGVTEHTQGTEGVMCLVNLALLTGNMGRRGAGINPLRGQNNVQGAAHMGCDPSNLTGAISIEDGKSIFESVWKASVPMTKGLNLLEMMDAAETGNLKALWAIGYDIFLTNANAHSTVRALKNLELLIVQDMFLNETAKEFGTVFLPAASSFEKGGTFMNAERRIQLVRKIIEPVGQSKSDWEIICSLARAMGKGEMFDYKSPEEIWDEIRSVWKAGSGITYSRLMQHGLQWPCPSEDHPGTEVLHAETFPVGKCAALRRIEYKATPEITNKEYPFLLTTGRTLYQFNAGTMTMRTRNKLLRPTDYLDISCEDARSLGLQDGDEVHLQSRYGEALVPVRISPCVKPGELFATFHTANVFLNYVTSLHRDSYVKAPEYKVTAVRLLPA
jgi:formate dehydrogenase major subunit